MRARTFFALLAERWRLLTMPLPRGDSSAKTLRQRVWWLTHQRWPMTVTIPPADLERFVSEVQDLRDVVNASIGKDTEIVTVEDEIQTLNDTLDQQESLLSLKKSEKDDLVLQATMQVDYLDGWLKYFRGEGPIPPVDPTPAPAPSTPST